MGLRIRRGSDEARKNTPLEQGEIVWTSSQGTTGANFHQLWVGTGIGNGGVNILESSAGFGLSWDPVTQRLEVSGLTADDVTNGVNNKYFTNELAVDAVAAALVAGNATNVGITFTYSNTQDDANRINATVALDGVGITDVVNDTTPQLGGDLDLNSNDITGTGNINITGDIDASGNISAGTVSASGILENGTVTIDGATVTVPDTTNVLFGSTTSNTGVVLQRNGVPTTLLTLKGLTEGPQASSCAIDCYSSRGSLSSLQAVQPSDALGIISGWGHTGSEYLISNLIGNFVDPNGTVSGTAVPGMIGLINFPDNNVANAKGVFINRKGWVTVGRQITDDATAHLDINGAMRLTPLSAAPANPVSGMLAVANGTGWNPTSTGKNTLVCYLGSAWVQVAVAP